MTDIRIGNINTTYGNFSPINFTQQAAMDPGTPLLDLIRAVEQMQAQLHGQDRQDVARFLDLANSPAAESPDQLNKYRLRSALQKVAGIATMAGQVGVPVIEAIRQLKDALGLLRLGIRYFRLRLITVIGHRQMSSIQSARSRSKLYHFLPAKKCATGPRQ